MPNRRRVILWLVSLAAVLTLSHLLGAHSGLHGHEAASGGHTAAHHDDGAGGHSHHHQDEGPTCGQALQPTSCDVAPGVERVEPRPEPVDAATATYPASITGGRSPPDLVSELQVNRV